MLSAITTNKINLLFPSQLIEFLHQFIENGS